MTQASASSAARTLRGRVWKFGDQVCGDDGIIEFAAVRDGFGKPFDVESLRQMCFRKLRPEFPSEVRPGDIVVGGANFAPHNHVEVSVALKASGISAVLVESCESGFIRRAMSQLAIGACRKSPDDVVRLQRGEANLPLRITIDDEPHQPAAQHTFCIIQHNQAILHPSPLPEADLSCIEVV